MRAVKAGVLVWEGASLQRVLCARFVGVFRDVLVLFVGGLMEEGRERKTKVGRERGGGGGGGGEDGRGGGGGGEGEGGGGGGDGTNLWACRSVLRCSCVLHGRFPVHVNKGSEDH